APCARPAGEAAIMDPARRRWPSDAGADEQTRARGGGPRRRAGRSGADRLLGTLRERPADGRRAAARDARVPATLRLGLRQADAERDVHVPGVWVRADAGE